MDKEKQRIKIAEVCGYTDIMLPMGFHQQKSDEKSKECGGRWRFEIPDYLNDLNMMHEAVKSIPQAMRPSYFACLCRVVSSRIALYGYSAATEATAEQRAEAFLRILDLWEE